MIAILLVPLAALAGILIIGFCAHGTRAHLRRNARRSPITRDLLRGPGHSLAVQVDDLAFDAATYLAIAPFALATLASLYLGPGQRATTQGVTPAVVYLLAALAVIGYCAWKVNALVRRLHRFRIGLESERAAAEELNLLMLQGYRVFHDVPADGPFNLDHVVVGASGVFAIETKGRMKPATAAGQDGHRVQSDGQTLQFPGWTEAKPLVQAERNAHWLSQWLSAATGEPVQARPLVLLPGWYVKRTRPEGVPVLNPKEIGKFLQAQQQQQRRPITDAQLRRIAHQLDARCRDIAPVVNPEREKAA